MYVYITGIFLQHPCSIVLKSAVLPQNNSLFYLFYSCCVWKSSREQGHCDFAGDYMKWSKASYSPSSWIKYHKLLIKSSLQTDPTDLRMNTGPTCNENPNISDTETSVCVGDMMTCFKSDYMSFLSICLELFQWSILYIFKETWSLNRKLGADILSRKSMWTFLNFTVDVLIVVK